MGDSKTLAKARRELEELYLGVPDDSVNLTFQDLAAVQGNAIKSNNNNALEKKKSSSAISTTTTTTTTEPIQEAKTPKQGSLLMNKSASLDFNRGLQASKINYHNQHHHHLDHFAAADHDRDDSTTFESYKGPESHGHRNLQCNAVSMVELGMHPSQGCHHNNHGYHDQSHHGHGVGANASSTHHHHHHAVGFRHTVESGMMEYDDVSVMSMASTYQERGGSRPRRPGIPHSNICTVCSTYIYIFRHRCLVCGRVFCRNCVSIGMGEMTEGRKCIECLGKRFSQRYIQRAGKVGCCSRYPSAVKQAELKWAEKGPRRTGERAYGHHRDHSTMGMRSRPRSPMTPTRTPTSTRPHIHHYPPQSNTSGNTPSFVSPLSSPYSPYHAAAASPHHFPL